MISRIFTIVFMLASSSSYKDKQDATTWGKSDIGYEQYKNDSITCAFAGYYRDVSQDDPAVRFILGWRAADTALNMPGGNGDSWGAAVARTQPDRKVAQLMAIQTRDVHECLINKGYNEIRLTRTEVKQLKKLKNGSEQRKLFLYNIASR